MLAYVTRVLWVCARGGAGVTPVTERKHTPATNVDP